MGNGNNPKSKNGKVTSFQPNTTAQQGDIVTSDQGGWWVCTATHTTGNTHDIKPGASNDKWHWAVPSS